MKALCDTLQNQGYETVGFTAGKEALAALRQSRFDLLLSDLMMPEMDGLELLRATLEIDPNLVAIIMTGQGTIDTAVKAMQSGALDYILKPFKLSAILPVINRALAVRQLRLENESLTQRVREHAAQLEAANKELEAFSYSVSHDLRAPLRSVKMFSKLLSDDHASQMPAEARHFLEQIITAGNLMDHLISDLLQFARTSRQRLSKGPVCLSELAREVLDELLAQNVERQIRLQIGDLPDCIADRGLLKQVLVNLFSNAFKFTRQRQIAIVEVGCREQNGERVYFIRDNGAGFDMTYADKLFGVFQRLHDAGEFEGTGVGLSIVQRIIQRHGGRIWAEGKVNEGATFYFTLPN